MKVYKYGDNVDTDVIIPARYLNAPDEKSLASHCMETSTPASPPPWSRATSSCWGQLRLRLLPGARPPGHQGLRRQVRHRALLRPHLLPQRHQHRLSHSGVRRGGGGIQAGDTVSVDFGTGVITDETTGKTYQAAPLPAFVQGIVDNGGLLKSLKARGAAK